MLITVVAATMIRAAHRNRKGTGLRPFYTGNRNVPLGTFGNVCTARHHTVKVGLRPSVRVVLNSTAHRPSKKPMHWEIFT